MKAQAQAAREVVDAVLAQLGSVGRIESAGLASRAGELAAAVAAIAADRARGAISEAQAAGLLAAQRSAFQAWLEAELGIVALRARPAVRDGLKALIPLAIDAAGIGWLRPLLRDTDVSD